MRQQHFLVKILILGSLVCWGPSLFAQISRLQVSEEDRLMQRWEQRTARVLLTDTAGQVHQGRIIYSKGRSFAWQEGHKIYQPGSPLVWYGPNEWKRMEINRRGFGFQKGIIAGLAITQVGMSLAIAELRSGRADSDDALVFGVPASLLGGILFGTVTGFLSERISRRRNQTYTPFELSPARLRNTAAYRLDIRVDTVDGVLVPRRSPFGLLANRGPYIGVEVEHGQLPTNSNLGAFGMDWPEFSAGSYGEPLYFYYTAYQSLSLFFIPRPGTRVGVRGTTDWGRTNRFQSAYEQEILDARGSFLHVVNRGRQWSVFVEQQVLPWRVRTTHPWRLSIGVAGLTQRLSSRKAINGVRYQANPDDRFYQDLAFEGPTEQIDEENILGVEANARLSCRLARHFGLFTIYRSQWVTSWSPPSLQAVAAENLGTVTLTPSPLRLSGTAFGVGASIFLW